MLCRYTVLHCHFLHHQDVGCMSVVQRCSLPSLCTPVSCAAAVTDADDAPLLVQAGHAQRIHIQGPTPPSRSPAPAASSFRCRETLAMRSTWARPSSP